MGRRRYQGRYRGYSDIGRERALQHIEEARELTLRLGGSDEDVKEYFFSLSDARRKSILDEYQRQHGRAAREYAMQTLPKWRTGRVHMSGMVATRLFDLLPPRMPLAEKYALIEKLWQHVGPTSKKVLRVGLDVDAEEAVAVAREHLTAVAISYEIPDGLTKQFDWLAAGDVGVKQQLLNYLRQHQQTLVVHAARVQLPVMLEHLQGELGANTHRLAQILRVGKHELEILVDRSASGTSLEEPVSSMPRLRGLSSSAPSTGGSGWLWWVVGGALLYWLFG